MTTLGSILLADDEATFRESTARLLQREGFACVSTSDADQAIDCLRRQKFDLLLTDIRMPRNAELRVVRESHEMDRQMAIILVTGYPSMETAISCVGMAVSAYLTKPLDYDELRQHVFAAVRRSQRRRFEVGVLERLESVVADLRTVAAQPLSSQGDASIFRMSTSRTLAACLSDLLSLSSTSNGVKRPLLCELLDCPEHANHRQVILHAIDVLKKTKDTFKSKVLAGLRADLERAMEEPGSGHL